MTFLYRNQLCSIRKKLFVCLFALGLVVTPLLATPPDSSLQPTHQIASECIEQPVHSYVVNAPAIVPPLICNGGDSFEPAKAIGRTGIEGLSAGDTVARYRRDDGIDIDDARAASSSHVTHSNCQCIYAPRFGSVRNVTQLHEESLPQGPAGLSNDKSLASQITQQPTSNTAQLTSLRMAKKSNSGIAVEERSGPLGVDTAMLPDQSLSQEKAGESIYDTHITSAKREEAIAESVGVDIPIAWTRMTAANAVFNDQQADVTSSSQGIAILRVESLGRAELTLCKRSGSDSARIGEEIDFTIAFINSGDVPLTDITIMDILPQRLQLIESSPATSLPAEIKTTLKDDGTTSISWQLSSTLEAGESGFVRMRTILQ